MAHVDLEGHIRPSGRTHPVAVRDCFVSGFRRKGRNGAFCLSAMGKKCEVRIRRPASGRSAIQG